MDFRDPASLHNLIVAPLSGGQVLNAVFTPDSTGPYSLSYSDGRANTESMAGEQPADWALGLTVGGFDDWYLPSIDELDILYRAFKPGPDQEHVGDEWRSGVNLSADPVLGPHVLAPPQQSLNQNFVQGGPEAFDLEAFYWSSSKVVNSWTSSQVWVQSFDTGRQQTARIDDTLSPCHLRAVRRELVA